MRSSRAPEALGTPFERYKSLPESAFRETLSPHLPGEVIDAFLNSRSLIIRYFNSIAVGNSRSETDNRVGRYATSSVMLVKRHEGTAKRWLRHILN